MMKMIYLLGVLLALPALLNSLPATKREMGENAGSEYNDGMFEGDIAGFPSDGLSRNGILDDNYLWKYRTVYYMLSEQFTDEERSQIHEAVEEYHRKTCLRLFEIPSEKKLPSWVTDYVYVTRENTGCWSYVGRQGEGRQVLNLQSPGCMSRGTIIHEFMHAIGFWHEQSRPDRDNYVTINKDNVEEGILHNFNLYDWDAVTGLGEPYDTESIMHYDAYAFAVDRSIKTIIPHDPTVNLGQRYDFSNIDIRKINRRYSCT